MNIGNRILFNPTTGTILNGSLGEMSGDLSGDLRPDSISFIDLEYGAINPQTHRAVSVDVETKKLILEVIEVVETAEQKRIRELEDALLLAADAEMGGIL